MKPSFPLMVIMLASVWVAAQVTLITLKINDMSKYGIKARYVIELNAQDK